MIVIIFGSICLTRVVIVATSAMSTLIALAATATTLIPLIAVRHLII